MRYEITILGVVQGVGYRPFVAALAEQLHIKGSVCNSGGVVRIDAFGDAEAMDNFICRLRSYAPPAARVDRVQDERACGSRYRYLRTLQPLRPEMPHGGHYRGQGRQAVGNRKIRLHPVRVLRGNLPEEMSVHEAELY